MGRILGPPKKKSLNEREIEKSLLSFGGETSYRWTYINRYYKGCSLGW